MEKFFTVSESMRWRFKEKHTQTFAILVNFIKKKETSLRKTLIFPSIIKTKSEKRHL